MENTRVNVRVPDSYDGKPIVIHLLDGSAPDPVNLSKKQDVHGNICAVGDFLSNQSINPTISKEKAIIECNHTAGTISLFSDSSHPHQWKVFGHLKPNKDLLALGINSKSESAVVELRNKLKFAAPLFADRAVHATLLRKLETIRVKFNKEIVDENDGKGNNTQSSSVKTDIDNGLTEKITLFCPLFEGEDAVKFDVEIAFSADGNKLTCWFESTE